MVKKILAIIPARGGSKGLPNKNILEFGGKPLIAHTVEAALKSKYITDVVVSTDSEKIAEAAKNAGAEIPFMRPAYLAEDNSKSIDVFLFTLRELREKYNREYDLVIILQPTSPLRDSKNIDEGIELYEAKDALSVISVKKAETPIAWYRSIDENMVLSELEKENANLNRQDYNELYLPNGAIYIFNVNEFLEKEAYYNDKTFAYIMDKESSVDIDDIYDFMLAEAIYNKRGEE